MILSSGIDDVTRDRARQAAHNELLNRKYRDAQPPLVVRLVGKVIRTFLELLNRAAGGVPGGGLGLFLLALVLAAFVAVILVRLRPIGRRATSADVFTTGRVLTAAEHRALADEAAATGQWAEAVRERLRHRPRARGPRRPRAEAGSHRG